MLTLGTASAQINLNKAKEKLRQKRDEITSPKEKEKVSTSMEEAPKNTGGATQYQEDEEEEKAPAPFTGYTQTIPPPIRKGDHGQAVGQILFSNKPITFGKEEKAAIGNTFKAGDQVFGMAYLSDTKINLGFERGFKIWIHDAEDGRGYTAAYEFGPGPYQTKADGTNNGTLPYYDLDIFANYQDAWDKGLAALFLEYLNLHLKNAPMSQYGTNAKKIHQLRVEIGNYEGLTIAEGTFYYDLTEGQEKMQAMYETHKQAALKEFKLPASKRNDPALAQKLKQIMVNEGVKVQKVVFSTPDWGMIRHEISGAVLRRSIWAYIVYKNDKGECHYDDVQFTEEFVGGAFNGIIKKAGYGTAHGQILCENLN
ncbi:MAG: hypothetical protein OHK0053_07320 [Microscillaceae bacterium]